MSDLTDFIENGQLAEAVRLLVGSSVSARHVIESFTDESKSDHSSAYVAFAVQWHAVASVEDKLSIARWVTTDAPLAFSDVENVRHTAAHLLVVTAKDTAAFISAMTDDAWVLADGPDAGISAETANDITQSGQALRSTSWPNV